MGIPMKKDVASDVYMAERRGTGVNFHVDAEIEDCLHEEDSRRNSRLGLRIGVGLLTEEKVSIVNIDSQKDLVGVVEVRIVSDVVVLSLGDMRVVPRGEAVGDLVVSRSRLMPTGI